MTIQEAAEFCSEAISNLRTLTQIADIKQTKGELDQAAEAKAQQVLKDLHLGVLHCEEQLHSVLYPNVTE